jgi:hypothetical protein
MTPCGRLVDAIWRLWQKKIPVFSMALNRAMPLSANFYSPGTADIKGLGPQKFGLLFF